MFDWDTGSGYDYDLSVKFEPDTPDSGSGTTGGSDTSSGNSTINTSGEDYNRRDFSETNAGDVEDPGLANEIVGAIK